MVSTRHHPRPFPEPTLAVSRTPGKEGSSSSTSSPIKTSPPPSPTVEISPTKRTPAKRSTRKSTAANNDATANDVDTKDTSTALTRTRSRRRTRSQAQAHLYTHHPSSLIVTWLIGSLILVVWDTGYVLGRPHTMPGGRFHSPFWTPYALYGTIDYMYGWPQWEKKNGFTSAQASLNVLETIMYVYYLFVVFAGVKDGWKDGVFGKLWREKGKGRIVLEGGNVAGAVLICWAAAIMTVSKTLLYALNEAFWGFDNVRHNDLPTLIFLWIIPNGAWLVLPSYMIYALGKEILSAMHLAGESGLKDD